MLVPDIDGRGDMFMHFSHLLNYDTIISLFYIVYTTLQLDVFMLILNNLTFNLKFIF